VPAPAVAQPTPTGATKASSQLGSMALGSVRATSVQGRTRRRRGAIGHVERIGAGLTHVPPAPAIDPAKAILADPLVPPDRRVCPQCGAKVGQEGDGIEGRSEGFCPQCGAPYSFTPKLAPGEVVAGQYEVVGALAHGGMGWIYLARDRNVSGRWVVLKGLLNAGDQDALAAAIGEQQYLARVDHPLIVEIYNFVTYADAGYIVMEYVGGRSLKQLLKQRMEANGGHADPLPSDQALAFLIEILPALGYLHEAGLLYCDFKPDNVIQVGDALKLIDLGGMRHANDDDSPIYGTVGFQAPEIATLGASVSSDIFTVGRTLMVLAADVPGYQSDYEHAIPPASAMPAFAAHDSLYRLLLRCCAPDPDDRFTSADELRGQMLGVLREIMAQAAGTSAVSSSRSPLFGAPSGIGDRPGWQYLPQLRLDADAADTAAQTLHRAVQAVADGDDGLVHRLVGQILADDPWDWRALWVSGLLALRDQRHDDAQAAFNAVYGQVPGELAPKLALATACEQGGELELAQYLYRVCGMTDAAYVQAAAFGVARIRAAVGDLPGTLTALALVPPTSRGYPEALRLRAHHLVTLTRGTDGLDDAFAAVASAPLPARSRASYETTLWQRAYQSATPGAARASARTPAPLAVVVGGQPLTRSQLRARFEQSLRHLATLTPEPAERARLVTQANSIRKWSLL